MKLNILIIIIFIFISGWHGEARAFWGSDERQTPSGLDVTAGYDINTVTTMRGTVISSPSRIDKSEHAQMTITTQKGIVTVLLGPWAYWERQGFAINREQQISVTGSSAQGKDGSEYIFAQKLENITTNTTITLRAETGSPMWSRSGSGQRSGSGIGAGSGYRGGSMRGSGRR